MATMIIKIISILGIVLLVLLGIILAAALLILFVPIRYRAAGKKQEKEIQVSFRASWLIGILRIRFLYPDSGVLSVTLLGFPLYQKSVLVEDTSQEKERPASGQSRPVEKPRSSVNTDTVSTESPKGQPISDETAANREKVASESPSSKTSMDTDTKKPADNIIAKLQKILDKIKHIFKEFDFYKTLLQDPETKALFAHALRRIGTICKHIRPRKISADILFGTGSPDTTGYAYGIYGMLLPHLGKNVFVTPDFTRQILQGDFCLKGHITAFTVLSNSLLLLLDKKLRLLINRIKRHQRKSEN